MRAVVTADLPSSDSLILGLGAPSLSWLLAGVLALTVGLVLATRRPRPSGVGRAAEGSPVTPMPNSQTRSGGVDR